MDTIYPFFISSHGSYKDVLKFSTNIDRFESIKKIKDVIGYLNYAYQIEKSIFEFCFDYALNNNYDFNNTDKINNLYSTKLDIMIYDLKNNYNIIYDIINKKLDPLFIAF